MVLSQFLATFLANIVMYFVICLLAFGLVNPGYMILMQLIDCVIAVVWTVVTRRLYNRIFQPWKILLIYGDRPASELVDNWRQDVISMRFTGQLMPMPESTALLRR